MILVDEDAHCKRGTYKLLVHDKKQKWVGGVILERELLSASRQYSVHGDVDSNEMNGNLVLTCSWGESCSNASSGTAHSDIFLS